MAQSGRGKLRKAEEAGRTGEVGGRGQGQELANVCCGSVSCEAIDQHFQLIFAPIIRQHYVAGRGEREEKGQGKRERVKEQGRERGRRSKGERQRKGVCRAV